MICKNLKRLEFLYIRLLVINNKLIIVVIYFKGFSLEKAGSDLSIRFMSCKLIIKKRTFCSVRLPTSTVLPSLTSSLLKTI